MTKELFEEQKDYILKDIKKLKSFGFDVKVVEEECLDKNNEVKFFVEADRFCEIIYRSVELERVVNILNKYMKMQKKKHIHKEVKE